MHELKAAARLNMSSGGRGCSRGKHSRIRSVAITSAGYVGEAPMPSWGLLGVSVIGTGAVSLTSPSRLEQLNH